MFVAPCAATNEIGSAPIPLQLTDSGDVSSTLASVFLGFDDGWGDQTEIAGDQLGQNRRLSATRTLASSSTTETGHRLRLHLRPRQVIAPVYEGSVML